MSRNCENCKFYIKRKTDNECSWDSENIPLAWSIEMDAKFRYLNRIYLDCPVWEANAC